MHLTSLVGMPLGAQNVIPWHSNLEMSRDGTTNRVHSFTKTMIGFHKLIHVAPSIVVTLVLLNGIGGGANDNDSTNIDADVDALDVGSG